MFNNSFDTSDVTTVTLATGTKRARVHTSGTRALADLRTAIDTRETEIGFECGLDDETVFGATVIA